MILTQNLPSLLPPLICIDWLKKPVNPASPVVNTVAMPSSKNKFNILIAAVTTQLFLKHVRLNTVDSFDQRSVDFRPCLPLQF